MIRANTLPYDPVEFQPTKLHKNGTRMSQTDDRRQTPVYQKSDPQNTVVIVFLGVEDHRATFFVSLALKVQVLASALALRVQALALALPLSVQVLVLALASMVQALTLAFKFWP